MTALLEHIECLWESLHLGNTQCLHITTDLMVGVERHIKNSMLRYKCYSHMCMCMCSCAYMIDMHASTCVCVRVRVCVCECVCVCVG